jgi:predicted transglutaminase-like cysteine proteinase
VLPLLQKSSHRWFVYLGTGLCLMCFLTVGHAFVANFSRLQDLAQARYGPSGRQAMEDWQRLLERAIGLNSDQQLLEINNFINRRMIYVEDLQLWGQKDYWATPLESLGRGAGDCEDSALAKYISLLQLGVADEKLRLIYVRARTDGVARAHMVLGYYPSIEQEPLVLDSLRNEILPASARIDLVPVFSFNASGLWVGGQSAAVTSPAARLSNWRSVLERMHLEDWR